MGAMSITAPQTKRPPVNNRGPFQSSRVPNHAAPSGAAAKGVAAKKEHSQDTTKFIKSNASLFARQHAPAYSPAGHTTALNLPSSN